MTEPLTLTIGCYETDRSLPLLDGRVAIPGLRLKRDTGDTANLFRRALRDRAFEITELSMSSHILTTARGDAPYVAVPIFLSRSFRHSAVYVRTDRGIRSAADLAGRTIGLPEYQQTAALWVRGMLREHYGVDTRGIVWRTGGLETPGAGERVALTLPPGHDVAPIPNGSTLNAMLADGQLDAIVGPRPPSCFTARSAPVDRLWPDYRAEEERYFDATGFFPIMHCLAIRKDVAEAHPWLPAALFTGFCRAKAHSLALMSETGVLRVTMPWLTAEIAAQSRRMGGNLWSYGFARNRDEIAAMIRYGVSDGLATQAIAPEALFHPSTLSLSEDAAL
jgi:4,5-dihydroxyphthalate decarboxylase